MRRGAGGQSKMSIHRICNRPFNLGHTSEALRTISEGQVCLLDSWIVAVLLCKGEEYDHKLYN